MLHTALMITTFLIDLLMFGGLMLGLWITVQGPDDE